MKETYKKLEKITEELLTIKDEIITKCESATTKEDAIENVFEAIYQISCAMKNIGNRY